MKKHTFSWFGLALLVCVSLGIYVLDFPREAGEVGPYSFPWSLDVGGGVAHFITGLLLPVWIAISFRHFNPNQTARRAWIVGFGGQLAAMVEYQAWLCIAPAKPYSPWYHVECELAGMFACLAVICGMRAAERSRCNVLEK